MMNDWCRLVERQQSNEDVLTVIPQLPQYKFKITKYKILKKQLTENVGCEESIIEVGWNYKVLEEMENLLNY